LIVGPPPGRCLDTTIGDAIDSPTVTSWADKDARLQFLTLSDVRIRSSRVIEDVSPAGRLVRAGESVLVADASVFEKHVTIVGFDVEQSDWPLKPSFVVFLRNLAELARSTQGREEARRSRTGQPLRLSLPAGVDQVTIEDPDGNAKIVPVRDSLALAPPPSRAGFYFAHWDGPSAGSRLVPVNLESDTEGDLRRAANRVAGSGESATRAPIAHVTSLAWLAAFAGLIFVLSDVWWATRSPLSVARLLTRRRTGAG
jgi:hypothetical protein